jgi:DNA-binding XRE family transcriptional regulator/desulfoferrodoxin (superoxide reductase-like protein)
MDHYVTGAVIKALREKQRMTQAEFAAKLNVSDKAVSKWETGRGFPDISLLEPLGRILHISVPELLCGQAIVNGNRSSNMLKSRFYVCPVCGNAIFARGDALISCCGIQLPPLEAEEPDMQHLAVIEKSEDEIFMAVDHSMGKDHYLAFAAYVTADHCEMKVLYPEGNAEARFFYRGNGWLYVYCNRHGLFRQKATA